MSKHPSVDGRQDRPRSSLVVAGGVLAFGGLLGAWIALAGQPDLQDLVAGSAAAAVSVAVGFLVSQRGRALPSFRRSDLRTLAALPWHVVVETGQVFAVAARKAAGRSRTTSGGEVGTWATVPIDAGGLTGWRAARRDSVITALLSTSPNTIVVDLDAEAGTALIHKLVDRSSRA